MPRLAVLLLFVLLAVAHTWPLARRPAVYSRVDNGDYNLNVWTIDWVARTLPSDPANLFDANIFHPAPLTLAYSEPLILPGVLAIPLVWLGVPPIATFNVLLIAGLALSGWAFALLVHRYTGSWTAGLAAGSAVAFSAHNLVRLVHIQALHLELLPLVFVALDRLLVTRRLRYALFFGAALAAQVTQSIYLLVFAGWAAVCGALARLPEWRGSLRAAAGWALAAGATCGLLLLPVLWPYAKLATTHGMLRTLEDAQGCAATWSDYLYTGSRVHYDAWSHRFGDSADASFPGLVVTALAAVALFGSGRRSPQVRMWLGVVVGSVLLSVLPRLPGFALLYDALPPMGAIRCYSRAGQMAVIGMAVLGGFGLSRLVSTIGSRRAAAAVGVALVAAINLEAFRGPLGYEEFPGVPGVYDLLRDERRAVVMELPFYNRRGFAGNSPYMVNATRHGHPLVNGYSGFAPRNFDDIAEVMQTFPEYPALELMHELGVTHVVVHRTSGMEERRQAIDTTPALRLLGEEGRVAIYRFVVR